MFERDHHRDVARVLQALDPEVLAARRCYFGGGTAMVLRHGEYRESIDIDFLVSDRDGYRNLRQMFGKSAGLAALLRPDMRVEVARSVRTDQYGIRTQLKGSGSVIKFEIVFEARIALSTPGPDDAVCGIATLAAVDLAAEKLLANADHWADDAVFSRDVIDLAMQRAATPLLRAACAKAEGAYGAAIRESLAKAIAALHARPTRLETCMKALTMTGISKAALWQALRRLPRVLPVPDDAEGDSAKRRR